MFIYKFVGIALRFFGLEDFASNDLWYTNHKPRASLVYIIYVCIRFQCTPPQIKKTAKATRHVTLLIELFRESEIPGPVTPLVNGEVASVVCSVCFASVLVCWES